MTIEVLFPELSNLYGDMANISYLQACMPEVEVIQTNNCQEPRFVTQWVDMLYLGSMPEQEQKLAVRRLLPYRERLKEMIRDGVVVLVTGNAVELFGQYITEQAGKTEMLGMFPYYSKRDMENRHNSMFLGRFEDIPIVGYKSQFSFCYGHFPGKFIDVTGGFGNNPKDRSEGFRYRNFFATYLLGPFLVLNPLFTKYLLRLLGHDDHLAFESETMEAFRFRKENLEKPGVNFLMGENG